MKLQKSTSETEQKVSPQQKKFQRLSKKIEQEKAILEQWKIAQQDLQARANNEILPAYDQMRQIQFQQIEGLVKQKQRVEQKKQKLTKGQLQKLDDKIEQLSFQLLQSGKMSDTQIKFLIELLNGYGHQLECEPNRSGQAGFDQGDSADEDFEGTRTDDQEQNDFEQDDEKLTEEELQLKIEALKRVLTIEYDLEPDFFDEGFDVDIDPENPDAFLAGFVEKIKEKLNNKFLDQFSTQDRKQFEREMAAEKSKAEKKQQQREQAKKTANQSLKTIYLKIAAMIHPDREQDELKKIEKTELLQQVNAAYAANDLLTLLALQVELGQQHNAPLADQQLKAYNIVLEEQLEKLSLELEDIIYSFEWSERVMYSNRKIKVQDLYKKYQHDWASVQQQLEREKTILEYYTDFTHLKELMRSPIVWDAC
ncbi:hypothetical protein EC844_12354 [Acinetobacter calcoaceticus]|uniref:Molecular chaperone DnaJ n=1 Tax=Acinetobacter calcoaceticus TaxID=471 RepID=A0A4R1XI03_ACICA|nr:hypothetical protein EC844_12354 [Acinetobacter calcoaceticus]